MTSEQVFYPGLWYLLLAFIAVSMPLYIFILWKSKRLAIVYLGVVITLGVYLAFFSARNFGGAFGAGMVLACLSVFLVPLSLLIWLLLHRPFKRKFEEDHTRRRLFVIGAAVIVLVQIFPLMGSYGINGVCFSATRNNAEPIIAAAQTYYQEFGRYPAEINELMILTDGEFPIPACSWLRGQEYDYQSDFEITECRDGAILLTNNSMDGSSIERYNFATGNWSAISFLDGACSHLR
jgi:hypothetical protein